MKNFLSLQNVSKGYATPKGSVKVLDDISLEIPEGAFVTFLGPSGCGKSTLLNLFAGFFQPDSGSILFKNAPITGPGKERVMIFQNDSIFPWLTVKNNIRFPLQNFKIPKAIIEEKIKFFLQLSQLTDFADYYPKQLSGGMRKRVDVARAFAVNPPCILADEPFASLDGKTKVDLYVEMMKLWEEEKNTIIFVTHDIEEGIFLSDVVYLLSSRPAKIYERIEIPFQRPRNAELMLTPEFQSLRKEIALKLS